MSYSFRFTSTHEDLLDAYAAEQRERFQMRPWIRACAIGLGFMWLAGVVLLTPLAIRDGKEWEPVVWFVVGSVIVWKFLFQPILKRRRIRTTTPPAQPLVLDFTDSGLRVQAEGVGVFDRAWEEIIRIEAAEKGVIMECLDGMVHWLPNRIFRSHDERQAFIDYVISRMPKGSEEVSDVA